MPSVNRTETVAYTPAQMYALVNDVRAYPEFLPWCSASEVHHEDEDEIQASLIVAGGGFRKRFTTHNHLQKDKMIEIRLINGPFKHLEGFWRFIPEANGYCTVALDMEFEFSGSFLDFAFGPVFHQISHTLVDAFLKRATDIYDNTHAD